MAYHRRAHSLGRRLVSSLYAVKIFVVIPNRIEQLVWVIVLILCLIAALTLLAGLSRWCSGSGCLKLNIYRRDKRGPAGFSRVVDVLDTLELTLYTTQLEKTFHDARLRAARSPNCAQQPHTGLRPRNPGYPRRAREPLVVDRARSDRHPPYVATPIKEEPQPMPSDFPFLDSLAEEIHKIHFETEAQAQQMVQKDLADLREKKDLAFKLAQQRIEAHSAAIDGMSVGLTKVIDKLSNNGVVVRPTGGGTVNSKDKSES